MPGGARPRGAPLRVALLSDWYLPRRGGIELHLADLAERLAAAGHRVDVLTTTPAGGAAGGPGAPPRAPPRGPTPGRPRGAGGGAPARRGGGGGPPPRLYLGPLSARP